MEATITSQPPRRRRRSPEEAEREIITAAESLLRERPFRELTVDEVMRRTGLSRPSFYVYELHGPVMRALADAAADDPDVERVYGDLVEGFVLATARHIEKEMAAGRVTALQPRPVAEALIWMNERFLNRHLGRSPQASGAMVVDTLAAIWSRTLYGT